MLETKRDMLDAKKFWGEKKKLKLENKGKLVGTILITFRNQDDEDGGGGGGELPIEGIDEDSALAIAIREAYAISRQSIWDTIGSMIATIFMIFPLSLYMY